MDDTFIYIFDLERNHLVVVLMSILYILCYVYIGKCGFCLLFVVGANANSMVSLSLSALKANGDSFGSTINKKVGSLKSRTIIHTDE